MLTATVDDVQQPELSVVVPLLNEEENVAVFLDVLQTTLNRLDLLYEIILVDDGSQDGTWQAIKHAAAINRCIKGISFSRNFGNQNALFAGLMHASGRAIVTMDGDLQHPPETIADLYQAWKKGYKVVNTVRIDSKKTSFFKRASSRWFYRVFSALTSIQMSRGSSDFQLIDEQVLRAIKDMRDADVFLKGVTHWVGFPRTTVTYQASDRYSGTSKWGVIKLFRYSIGAIVSFSSVPLKLGIWVGLLTGCLAFAEVVFIVIRYFQGLTLPGWSEILTVISFMFGMLFFLVGLIGLYLGRMHEILKNRPRFLVNESVGFISEDSDSAS